jgi:hypothetical protein
MNERNPTHAITRPAPAVITGPIGAYVSEPCTRSCTLTGEHSHYRELDVGNRLRIAGLGRVTVVGISRNGRAVLATGESGREHRVPVSRVLWRGEFRKVVKL